MSDQQAENTQQEAGGDELPAEQVAEQPQPANESFPDTPAAPTLRSSIVGELEHCPACRVGLLYPITHDPGATFEIGQGQAAQHAGFTPSGGAQLVRCLSCTYQESQPLGGGKEA